MRNLCGKLAQRLDGEKNVREREGKRKSRIRSFPVRLKPQWAVVCHRCALSTAGSVSDVSLLNLLFLIPASTTLETFETPEGEIQCKVKSVGRRGKKKR